MRATTLCLITALSALTAACSDTSEVSHGDRSGGAAAPAPALTETQRGVLGEFGEVYLSANLNNGARVWRSCQSCHTLPEGARHMVGPNLNNLFDRQVGGAQAFRYSDALTDADFVWTPDLLDQWLANPRDFLPGNRMSFAGLRQAEDRRDLIAYLAIEPAPAE